MRNIIGAVASGNDFYNRPREIENIQRGISLGINMQIAAPRRVGKTSILIHFRDNPSPDYYYVYVDTESVSSENEYFKRLYEALLKSNALSGTAKIIDQIIAKGNQFLKRLKGIKIMGTSIELSEVAEIDYSYELSNLLKGLDLDGKKIVLMIDEFPEVILNIYSGKEENINVTVKFLKSNRELRQDPDITKNIVFIYTGSIGLNHTVARFDASSTINDLKSIGIEALLEEEAIEMVKMILASEKIKMGKDEIRYLLNKVEWLMPFHIQLAISEIIQLHPVKPILNEDIDKAFANIISNRNNNYFEHYISRLRRAFKGIEYEFANDLLKQIAEQGIMEEALIYDLAVKYNLQKEYKKMLHELMYDGYINNNDDFKVYRFNSPILKMWWQKYV